MKKTFKLAGLAVLSGVLLTSVVSTVTASDDASRYTTTSVTDSCTTVSCKLGTKKEKQEKYFLSDAVIKIIDKFVEKVDDKAKNEFGSLSSEGARNYVMGIYNIVVEKFYDAAVSLERDPEIAKNDKTPRLVGVLKDIAQLFNIKMLIIQGKYTGDNYYYNITYKWDERNNYNPNSSSNTTDKKDEVKKEDTKKEDTSSKNDSVELSRQIKNMISNVKSVLDNGSSVDKTLYEAYSKNLKGETIGNKTVTGNFVLEIGNEYGKKVFDNEQTNYDFTKLLTAGRGEVNFLAMFAAPRTIDVVKSEYAQLKSTMLQGKDSLNQDTQATEALTLLNNFDKGFFNDKEGFYGFAPFESKQEAKEFITSQKLAKNGAVVQIGSTNSYAVFFNPFQI